MPGQSHIRCQKMFEGILIVRRSSVNGCLVCSLKFFYVKLVDLLRSWEARRTRACWLCCSLSQTTAQPAGLKLLISFILRGSKYFLFSSLWFYVISSNKSETFIHTHTPITKLLRHISSPTLTWRGDRTAIFIGLNIKKHFQNLFSQNYIRHLRVLNVPKRLSLIISTVIE